MNPLEAVADAIMKFEGWAPGTRSYVNRNPGNLEGGQYKDDRGYNVYKSLCEGYTALVADLFDKFTGNNKHGLGPKSTVIQLMSVYAPPSENPTLSYAEFLAGWLTKALGKPISPTSELGEIYNVEIPTPQRSG